LTGSWWNRFGPFAGWDIAENNFLRVPHKILILFSDVFTHERIAFPATDQTSRHLVSTFGTLPDSRRRAFMHRVSGGFGSLPEGMTTFGAGCGIRQNE
jgi:hypothetical protein